MSQGFQLSPQQRRVWQLQSESYDGGCLVQVAVDCRGEIDEPALRAALERVVAEQEILRTRFEKTAGLALPVQVIEETPVFALETRDLSGASDPLQALAAEIATLAAKPVDPFALPALHAVWIDLGAGRGVLHLRAASVCADRKTLELLAGRLFEIVGSGDAGESEGDEEGLQYADLSQWMTELLGSEDAEEPAAAWSARELGASRPRVGEARDGSAPSGHSETSVTLPESLASGCRALAERRGVSVEAVLLAAYGALFARTGTEAPLLLGVAEVGRTYEELAGAFGPFAKFVPHRFELGKNDAFDELLAETAAMLDWAEENQEFFNPGAARDAEAPEILFEMVVLPPASRAGELEYRVGAPLEEGSADLATVLRGSDRREEGALRLSCYASAGAIELALTHAEGSSSQAEGRLLLTRLVRLLESAASSSSGEVAKLDLLPTDERERLVAQLSRGASMEGAAPEPIHVRAARHAAEDGSRVAVRASDGRSMTYAELDAAATRLAARLRDLGVGPDDFVGLCCGRSPEMLVGILGVHKAGGAYLPLDPSYPAERLAFMMSDSGAKVLVARDGLAGRIGEHGATVVDVDDVVSATGGAEPFAAGPETDLAYAIYTSGSTGKPKGVGITQRNLAWSTSAREAFYERPVERYLLLPSFAFDSSVAGIFWALAQGGTLVLPADGQEREPHELTELIRAEKVTHLLTLPSVYELLLEAASPGALSSLETAIVAGEECTPELVRAHFDALPGARLVNEYGPTEATVWCTAHVCRPEDATGSVPIGRPIPGAHAYVVDRGGDLAPLGVPGELVVGGPGVARGYLGRPELTDERFVADRFTPSGEGRLYATGDLVDLGADGALRFLGRIDEQVKIRGYRIELGEIESRLRAEPAVEQAVVAARGDSPGSKRLVAYVVLGGGALDEAALRRRLEEELPEYMVPSAFVALADLPLLPNGKVDKGALPEPDESRPQLGVEYVAPSGPVEELLARIWSQTLGLEKVGTRDGFFELGGNSIQAAVLINKLQSELGEYLHVATLFRYPKIADFAGYLQENYAEALTSLASVEEGGGRTSAAGAERVDDATIEEIVRIITPLADPDPPFAGPKNRRAVFILSPPRSGSTLLRAMLSGNETLFVPPELELLNFNTMVDRAEELTGAEKFLGEGLIRAVMQARACDVDEAEALVDRMVGDRATSKEVYRSLQEWIGGKTLVDKTACYTLDPATLARTEELFDEPLYLHLVRHPHGMINSFVEVRLEQVFFRYEHVYDRRRLAELVWNVCHRNILGRLESVPAERQARVRFEDLLAEPKGELGRLCEFLDVQYTDEMLKPYENRRKKMLDGTTEHSKMQGDPRFLEHDSIDASVAERWRTAVEEDFLGEPTWRLAESFGYERLGASEPGGAPEGEPDVEGMSDDEVKAMLEKMLAEESDRS